MALLTRFQRRCLEALDELLEHEAASLTTREVVSNGECLVHATVEGRDLEIWIYDDEAEFQVGGRGRHYESVVFRNEAERISSFIADLQRELHR